jgi:plastocyanin
MQKKLKIPTDFIFLIILIVAIGSGSIYVFLTPSSQPEKMNERTKLVGKPFINSTPAASTSINDPQEPAAAFIYTDEGFNPKTVSIRVGQKVLWRNASLHKMLITASKSSEGTASSNPDFNQSKAVEQDGLFLFLFWKSGVYTFENKERPSDKGSVTVTE